MAEAPALELRLLRVPARALLRALLEAGVVTGPEAAAALAPPGGPEGWARRVLAMAHARGEAALGELLRVLRRLEEPGPLDFDVPHSLDCPCCRLAPPGGWEEQGPEEEAEGPIEEEEEEEEDGDVQGDDGDPHEDNGDPQEDNGDPQEDNGDPQEDDGDPQGDEGEGEAPEEEEEGADEGPEEEADGA